MTTLIKDLIDLPERVHSGDFVLKLADGVAHPQATLRDYVVTSQLARCFDAALDFIRSGVESGSSKAAYLHGSFGSGKSHFMAVLHLMLGQHGEALAKEGLEEVVARHNAWLSGRRFLLVPYHMIGQPGMEAAVLGGYVRHVAKLHPDAPVPPVFLAAGLFDDAAGLRETMGDQRFFEALNRNAAAGGGGWGDLAAAWDAETFEAALAAPPDREDRGRLLSDLVRELFPSYRDVARGSHEAYVSLDDGLAIVSRHAGALGYDGLVLFLDELILWLATHASDQNFLNTEGAKVSKLVEAESAERPVPILSFVARQRDLRELVGEHVLGAQQVGFADVLRYWEARFDRITLEDRNLPEIASRRVLVPRSEAARQQLEQSYEETAKVRHEVLEVLLTPNADRGLFRKVYPFSPALVETLVAVSSALQRERTALKLMQMLLVEQRDTLELGQIVPVGDLFDVIADGDEPFTEGMRLHFANAKRLYEQKLRPMLEKECEITAGEAAARPPGDGTAARYRAGDRLLKTLLLAALVPEVEVLKALTPARLAALNHGSVRSPIPGREASTVLKRVRDWAAQVGEIKLGDDPVNPTVSLQLSGVDTESILANVQAADNAGNRRRLVRELLFAELGIAESHELFVSHRIVWRGTEREFEVIFGNIREHISDTLATGGDQRKVLVDFPFDDNGSAADDLARLDDFRSAGKTARTLAWVPSFLSASAQRDLGTLVRIQHVLTGERFRDAAAHLSPTDQSIAREQLKSQGSSLRQRLVRYLEGAYGADEPAPGSVDASHTPAEHFQSLDPSFEPRPPARANLRQALEHLLEQMLESQYPAHPRFGTELKTGVLRKVHDEVMRAVGDKDGRALIEKPLRPLMLQVAVPLGLGRMGDTHFVAERHWYTHFQRSITGDITVGRLREAMERPSPMGLPVTVQNLVILFYAAQANRTFFHHGGPARATLESLPDELELREQPLPDEAAWQRIQQRAGDLFGIAASPLRNAGNVAALLERLDEVLDGDRVTACRAVVERLARACDDFGIPEERRGRLRTARELDGLLRALERAERDRRLAILADAKLTASGAALGSSYQQAASMRRALEDTRWQVFEGLANLAGDRAAAAEGLRRQLAEALGSDEYAVSLAPKLADLERKAIALLMPPPAPAPPGPAPAPRPPAPTPAPGVRELGAGQDAALPAGAARAALQGIGRALDEHPEARLDLAWRLYREGEDS